MKLDVKMFGALGRREETFELPDGATGSDVLCAVATRYPDVAPLLDRVSVAVNLEVVSRGHVLRATDEVALLPPMSGGAAVLVGLRERPSLDEAMAAVSHPHAGGVATFVGTVRDHSDAGVVERLDYSAYDEMADRVMTEVAVEAAEKWSLDGVAILHATGSLGVGDPTMVVACAAPHRDEAFDACRYVVDEVKRRAPIWKKEFGPWGERWIGA